MLTLRETLADQEHLDQLCADRLLKTSEVFAPNAFYGIDSILKAYAGLPAWYRLKAVVPHGVTLHPDALWQQEIDALLPAVLCYPPYREGAYTSRTDKNVVLSASPFLYLLALMEEQPRPVPSGTIFFPSHSTHHVTVQMEFERLADVLAALAAQYQPVTVCLYWRDYNLGYHLPFQRRGLRVVSAGHMFDRNFLSRFYHLCSLHRYAASNAFGSHLFYAVKTGCSYFHLDAVEYTRVADPAVLKRDVADLPPTEEAGFRSLFGTPRPAASDEQKRIVDYYLGAAYLKTPRELRRQLLQAEWSDKVSVSTPTRDGRRVTVPTAYLRGAALVRRAYMKIGRYLTRVQPDA